MSANSGQDPQMIAAFSRVEKAVEDGFSRVEGRISSLESEMKHLSESSIRQDERLRAAQVRLQQLGPLEDKVEDLDRSKAKLVGIGIGAGGMSGGLLSYFMKYFGG